MKRFGLKDSAVHLMGIRASWLQFALQAGLTIHEVALPFCFHPESIYERKYDWGELCENIISLRRSLKEYCEKEEWERCTETLLRPRSKKDLIPGLLREDAQISQLWSIYLKPLLKQYPSSKIAQVEIGGILS